MRTQNGDIAKTLLWIYPDHGGGGGPDETHSRKKKFLLRVFIGLSMWVAADHSGPFLSRGCCFSIGGNRAIHGNPTRALVRDIARAYSVQMCEGVAIAIMRLVLPILQIQVLQDATPLLLNSLQLPWLFFVVGWWWVGGAFAPHEYFICIGSPDIHELEYSEPP